MADSKAAAAPAPGAAPAKGKEAQDAGKTGAKKRNPKQMIIIAAAVLLLAAAGAGTWFFFFRGEPEAEAAAAGDSAVAKDGKDAKDKKDKKAEVKKPFFVDFEAFTVNLRDPEKFLQIKITLQIRDVEAAETLKDMMPAVRAAIIPVLSNQDAAELATAAGKEKLSADVVAAAKKAVAGMPAEDSIDAALITHMIIQ